MKHGLNITDQWQLPDKERELLREVALTQRMDDILSQLVIFCDNPKIVDGSVKAELKRLLKKCSRDIADVLARGGV